MEAMHQNWQRTVYMNGYNCGIVRANRHSVRNYFMFQSNTLSTEVKSDI